MRYKFNDWMEAKRRYFFEMNMPDQASPVVIVFGGTFSPVHKGHMDTAVQAKDFVESQGYKVSKVLLSPVGDTLAKGKLGADWIPFSDRLKMLEIASQSYPGVMATGEPGRITDSGTAGKQKRTALADWAKNSYGDVTVMALCGADSCPPTVPSLPAIYTGDEGTSHYGYWYIGMPRDEKEGISSSKIRNAIKLGQPASQWLPAGVEEYLKEIYKPAAAAPNPVEGPRTVPTMGGDPKGQPLSTPSPVGTMNRW